MSIGDHDGPGRSVYVPTREATCRGSIALGSGCKRCSRCKTEMENIAQAATATQALERERAKPSRVKKKNLKPGFYVVFNSYLGTVGHIQIIRATDGLLYVWGLSRHWGAVEYRTMGVRLGTWLGEDANKKAKFFKDVDWSALFGGE